MMKILYAFLVAVFFLLLPLTQAEEVEDGTHDATVTTKSGTYTVPVEVEDGKVTHVEWPKGGNMSVDDAELDDGTASGTNSRGEDVEIEIDK